MEEDDDRSGARGGGVGDDLGKIRRRHGTGQVGGDRRAHAGDAGGRAWVVVQGVERGLRVARGRLQQGAGGRGECLPGREPVVREGGVRGRGEEQQKQQQGDNGGGRGHGRDDGSARGKGGVGEVRWRDGTGETEYLLYC